MTAREFAEWQAYDSIDPIGGYRTDLGFALLAYIQAGDKNSKISDYLLIDPNPKTDDEYLAHEQAQNAIQARKQVADLIAMFNKSA